MKNTIREGCPNDLVCQQCFVWKKGLLHCVVATKVKVHKKL